jgi:hypothetical protein
MAGGHVNSTKRPNTGCTDQQSDVKILLANSEPSTHDTSRYHTMSTLTSAFGSKADNKCSMRTFPLLTQLRLRGENFAVTHNEVLFPCVCPQAFGRISDAPADVFSK